MEESAIQIHKLEKSFGSKKAVKGITLDIKKGELFSLLGVNGAGKTTTIRMLCGLSKPDAGEVTIFGYNLDQELDEIKKITNLSPQETAVADHLTVRENLEFIVQIYHTDIKGEKIKGKVDQMIQRLSLEEYADTKAKKLSGGWKRRLSIAMALITEPKVLYLDEPTLGLDVLARRELWDTIQSLKGKITIILTTHYLEEAQMLSDRIAVMADGELKALGTLEQLEILTKTDNLEDAFVSIVKGSVEDEK